MKEELIEENADNKEFILEEVAKQGSILDLASERLKNDKEVVLTAIKNDGGALEFASKELKDDKEVVLEAVKEVRMGFMLCE